MSKINGIIVTGKFGAGKSTFVDNLTEQLMSLSLEFELVSDRLLVEEKILTDIKRGIKLGDGSIMGKHSVLVEDGAPGKRKFQVRDGVLLNYVHDEMIKSLQQRQDGLLLMEYAIGQRAFFDEGREPLLQSGKDLLTLLEHYKVVDQVVIIEIESSLTNRAEFNSRREDSVPDEAFRRFAQDGGEFYPVITSDFAGIHYLIKNETFDQNFLPLEAKRIINTYLLPMLVLEGVKNSREKR